MSHLLKAVFMGLLTGVLGLSLVPFALDLEENLGLGFLFKLRGPRKVPPEVIIITIDKASADNLNLPAEPAKWPRSLHATLTENLSKAGAAVIVFDILFDEARSPEQDSSFAEAIRNARNVVLCECLKKKTILITNKEGTHTGQVNIEKLVPPIPTLAQSAAALAPFPLPKVPIKVSQYWTIKTGAGDTPTLPVVVFQVYALGVYEELISLLKKAKPDLVGRMPQDKRQIAGARSIEKVIRTLRQMFKSNPGMADDMLTELEQWNNSLLDSKQSRLLRSLIKMYGGPHSRYLNFYGPPGTVHTASYHQIVRTHDKAGAGPRRYDFRGKAVFVGLSERLRPEQKDGFHTVFSQPSGVDISGVEVAATAFGNLLEDMPVQPLRLGENLLTIFLWGMLLGMGCHLLSPFFGALGVVGVSALYVFIVLHQFKFVGEWFPLTIPLLFQSPFAFFGGVIWKYFDTNRERQNIRKAFGYYLPDKVVDQLTRNLSDIKSTGQVVYGTCLFTDAEQYTTLSETMGPNELHSFMNKYFEALFEPVTQQGGIIAEVFGDGMLALWSTPHSDVKLRHQACLAALSIGSGVNQFNQSSDSFKLPTRIGLHSGYMFLGHVGAVDHYEYRPTGDIVNTASRIEGLNKYLRTRILVSQDVLYQLEGFLTRELGRFLLVGKSNPLTVYDLICRIEDSDESQRALCLNFGAALNAYKRQAWKQAIKLFNESTKISDEDGPSVFYLRLCERYRETPPGPQWDGVVQLTRK